jgi:hypothetical protein
MSEEMKPVKDDEKVIGTKINCVVCGDEILSHGFNIDVDLCRCEACLRKNPFIQFWKELRKLFNSY